MELAPEHVYSAGAFLLDIKEPHKILGRTKAPLLAPEEDYETKGDVNNVVFPTGACILDNELFVVLMVLQIRSAVLPRLNYKRY